MVTLLYFEGCPHWEVADRNVRLALREVGLGLENLHHRKVETAEDAQRLGFLGSPTIRIDGRDPFADSEAQVGMSCRVYRTPDGPSGAPTVEQLCVALRALE